MEAIENPSDSTLTPGIKMEWRYVKNYLGRKGSYFSHKDETEEWHADGGYYRFFLNLSDAPGTELLNVDSIESFSLTNAKEDAIDFSSDTWKKAKLNIASLREPVDKEILKLGQMAVIVGKNLILQRSMSARHLTWHRAPESMQNRLSLVVDIYPLKIEAKSTSSEKK